MDLEKCKIKLISLPKKKKASFIFLLKNLYD